MNNIFKDVWPWLNKSTSFKPDRGFYIYLFLLLWRENQLSELSSFQMIQNLLFVNLTMFWMKIVNSAAGASLAYDELVTWKYRSSHTGVFLENGVLKICSKFTGEHPCRSVFSINLQSNFIEITFRHACSPVNFLHIFTTIFTKCTSRWLLLNISSFFIV